MIATSPASPPNRWELQLDDGRFAMEALTQVLNLLFCITLLFFMFSMSPPWGALITILSWIANLASCYMSLYLRLHVGRIRLNDEGVELSTIRRTRTVPYDQISEIRKDPQAPNFKLKFSDRRFISDISGDNAEAFMTELSARSGVPIHPPRFA